MDFLEGIFEGLFAYPTLLYFFLYVLCSMSSGCTFPSSVMGLWEGILVDLSWRHPEGPRKQRGRKKKEKRKCIRLFEDHICSFGIGFCQGMSEDVSINKFFDEAMVVELAQQAADLHQQMM